MFMKLPFFVGITSWYFVCKRKKIISHHIFERPFLSLPSCFLIVMLMSFFLSCSYFHSLLFPSLSFLVSQFDLLSGNSPPILWGDSCRLKNKVLCTRLFVYKDSIIILHLKSSNCFIALVQLPLSLFCLSLSLH